jgi:hypothetical protein
LKSWSFFTNQLFKFEIQNPEHETNAKFKISNAQNNFDWNSVASLGHCNFGHLRMVWDFDIGISSLPLNLGSVMWDV